MAKHIRFLFLTQLLAFLSVTSSAQKWDYQIPYGNGSVRFDESIYIIDFNDGSVSFLNGGQNRVVISGGTSIATSQGRLALYTEGCLIYNRDFTKIAGQPDTLTPHPLYWLGCVHNFDIGGLRGWTGGASHLFLPNLLNPNEYWLLHRSDSSFFDGYRDQLVSYRYFKSTIQADALGNIYDVNRVPVFEEVYDDANALTAVPNEEETGWWFYTSPRAEPDSIRLFCLYPDSIYGPVSSLVDPLNQRKLESAQAAFSATGDKFAIGTEQFSVFLYDFDRRTGKMTFDEEIKWGHPEYHISALGFSNSGRFLYVGKRRSFQEQDYYQVDLWDDDLTSKIYDYGKVYEREHRFALGNPYLAPDCRMYFMPTEAGEAMSILRYPDRKGAASGLIRFGIQASGTNYSLPTLPQYRALTPCDSTISLDLIVDTEEQIALSSFSVAPNPVQEILFVHGFAIRADLEVEIVDALQRVHLQQNGTIASGSLEIDVSTLPAGIYFLRIRNHHRVFKFVKM